MRFKYQIKYSRSSGFPVLPSRAARGFAREVQGVSEDGGCGVEKRRMDVSWRSWSYVSRRHSLAVTWTLFFLG